MKIIQMVDSLNIGGTERMVVNISNLLATKGITVYLIVTRGDSSLKEFIAENVNVVCINKRHSFDIVAFMRLVRIVKNNKIDIIHAHSSSVVWAVLVKTIFKRISIIWHDHLGRRSDMKFSNKFLALISGFFDAVITVNENLRDWSITNLRVPPGRIFYLKNFYGRTNEIETKREVDHTLTILSLANLRWQKDQITLIRAISILVKDYGTRNFKVQLVGNLLDKPYYQKVIDETIELQLQEFVEFVGSVPNPSEYLLSADIGVLSSVSEGLPLSILEYGYHGLAVVATDVGQCSEVLGYGKYGKIVPPSSPRELAAAIHNLLVNPIERISLGFEYKEHIEKEYSEDTFWVSYFEILEVIDLSHKSFRV